MLSELDPRSLIFVAGLLGLLCSAILYMMRRSFPPTIGGLVHWSRGLLAMVVASALFGTSGIIPDLFCIVLANVLLVGGVMLVYAGFLHFAGRPAKSRLLIVVLALLTCYVSWFTYIDPNYPARALLVTSTDTALFFACAVLVFRTSGDTLAGRFTCMIFLGIGTISGVRALMLFLQFDTPSSLFGTTISQKIYLASLAFSVLAVTLGAMMMANERLRTALEFIASHDQLTDAYARGAFIELLSKELSRSQRNGCMPALLMFDLDNFKTINDRFGHAVGDRVIVDFAHRAKEMLRNQDSLGRYGGEEFVALLPETTLDEAQTVAERICTRIAAAPSTDLPPYTVSIGVAAAIANITGVDSLLSRADQALYLAKANGRNRVEADHQEQPVTLRLFS